MRRFLPLTGLVVAVVLAGLSGCTGPSQSGGTAASAAREATSPAGDAKRREPAGPGRDVYVLLSGGGTPMTNNYSQYLQARGVAAFFERECPPESTWVFFGIGNREGAPPVLADVRRESTRDGVVVQSWLPGTLKNNRPATRDSFLRALREEILPAVRGGGTLHLFVGDHGELTGTGDKRESAITMWQVKRGRRRGGGWVTDEKEIFGVAELRSILAQGLGDGRVLFCMTQCHAGGFHELGVAREMPLPRAWFASGRAPAAGTGAGLRLRVAGFTATDEASPAAGCVADPDPESWAGYERYFPEALFGVDLMTGQRKSAGTRSFAEAHEQATLVDQTIDKPRSTVEHYLEGWARAIETRLSGTLDVTEATRRAVAAYQQSVDRGRVGATDEALVARREQFERFTRRISEQVPAAAELVRSGTRSELEAAIGQRGGRGGGRGSRRGAVTEARKAWTETLRPAWKSAVMRGGVAGLTGAAGEFEKRLLTLEDDGADFLLPRGGNLAPLLSEVYWFSGYAEPARLQPARAEAIARWGAERRSRVVAWAKESSDAALRAAAEKIGPGPAPEEAAEPVLTRRTAAERVLYYRRVLAAWEFLHAVNAQGALAELRTLLALETLPLRKP